MGHSRSKIIRNVLIVLLTIFFVGGAFGLYLNGRMSYFPVCIGLYVLLLYIVYHVYFKRVGNIHEVRSVILYRLRRRVTRHELKVLDYSILMLFLLSMGYEILLLAGKKVALFPILLTRKEYYPLIITICSLMVTLLLTIKIDTKRIKTGLDFIAALEYHTQSLEDRYKTDSNRNKLHIYSPNINLGVSKIIHKESKESTMKYIIEHNPHVDFVFHCNDNKSELSKLVSQIKDIRGYIEKNNESPMLNYLYERYINDQGTKIGDVTLIIKDLSAILSFSNVELKKDNDLVDEAGYYSIYECMFGQFQDIDAKNGAVGYFGEIVTTPQFLSFIQKHGMDIELTKQLDAANN